MEIDTRALGFEEAGLSPSSSGPHSSEPPRTDSGLWRDVKDKLGSSFAFDQAAEHSHEPVSMNSNDTDILVQEPKSPSEPDVFDSIGFSLGAKFDKAHTKSPTPANSPDGRSQDRAGDDWTGGEDLSTNSLSEMLSSMQTRLSSLAATPMKDIAVFSQMEAPRAEVVVVSTPAIAATGRSSLLPKQPSASSLRATPSRSSGPPAPAVHPRSKSPAVTAKVGVRDDVRAKSPAVTKPSALAATSSTPKPSAGTAASATAARRREEERAKSPFALKTPVKEDSSARAKPSSAISKIVTPAKPEDGTKKPSAPARALSASRSSTAALSKPTPSAEPKLTAASRPATSFKPLSPPLAKSSAVAARPSTPTSSSSAARTSSTAPAALPRSQSGTRLATSRLSLGAKPTDAAPAEPKRSTSSARTSVSSIPSITAAGVKKRESLSARPAAPPPAPVAKPAPPTGRASLSGSAVAGRRPAAAKTETEVLPNAPARGLLTSTRRSLDPGATGRHSIGVAHAVSVSVSIPTTTVPAALTPPLKSALKTARTPSAEERTESSDAPSESESVPSEVGTAPNVSASPEGLAKRKSPMARTASGHALREASAVGDSYLRRAPESAEAAVIVLHPSALLVAGRPPAEYMPPLSHSSQAAVNAIYSSAPHSALRSGASTPGFVTAAKPAAAEDSAPRSPTVRRAHH